MIRNIKRFIDEFIEYNKYKLPKSDKLLNIHHLEAHISKIENVDLNDKKNVRIAFVDDEGYETGEIKKLGYVDSYALRSFDKISDFEQYDVVFCDINGVAIEIDPINQGAELANQIKQNYPEKTVVIFTSRKHNIDIANYKDKVDNMIPKNVNITKICDIIDEHIRKHLNPISYWKNKERTMRKKGVPNNIISIVEHYYVLSMIEKKDLIDDVLLKYKKKFPIDEFIDVIEEINFEIIKKIMQGGI